MTDAARAWRPILLLAIPLAAPLGGCGGPGLPPVPAQASDAPRFACPDGHSFTTQFDPTTHQTDLWLDGGAPHRLDPVPDPLGGVLYQDADYQLRPGGTDASRALTDRSTTQRQACSRAGVMNGSRNPPP